jgi:hypothetical protein
MKIIKTTTIIAILSMVSSCESIKKFDFRSIHPKALFGDKKYPVSKLDFVANAPQMNIRKFLDGELEGHGVKFDKNNQIIEVQNVKIKSQWQANKAQIQIDYLYDNQLFDSRTWLLTLNSNGNFEAIGHDSVGQAKGRHIGNAMQMVYNLLLPHYDKKIETHFDDKYYLVDEKSAILISKISKFYQYDSSWIFSLKKIDKSDPKLAEVRQEPKTEQKIVAAKNVNNNQKPEDGKVISRNIDDTQLKPTKIDSRRSVGQNEQVIARDIDSEMPANFPPELMKFRPKSQLVISPNQE